MEERDVEGGKREEREVRQRTRGSVSENDRLKEGE